MSICRATTGIAQHSIVYILWTFALERNDTCSHQYEQRTANNITVTVIVIVNTVNSAIIMIDDVVFSKMRQAVPRWPGPMNDKYFDPQLGAGEERGKPECFFGGQQY
jgi:hypothetical protein